MKQPEEERHLIGSKNRLHLEFETEIPLIFQRMDRFKSYVTLANPAFSEQFKANMKEFTNQKK